MKQAIVGLIAAASAVNGACAVLARQLGTGQQQEQHKKLCDDLEKAIEIVKKECFNEDTQNRNHIGR